MSAAPRPDHERQPSTPEAPRVALLARGERPARFRSRADPLQLAVREAMRGRRGGRRFVAAHGDQSRRTA